MKGCVLSINVEILLENKLRNRYTSLNPGSFSLTLQHTFFSGYISPEMEGWYPKWSETQ